MADKKINIDLVINTANSASSIRDVKASIKELQDAALTFGEGTQEFDRATAAAGKLKDKIDDVNDAIAAKKGEGFEQFSTQLGQIGESLIKLDFGKANEQITGLASTVKGFSFKGVIDGVKGFGSAMLNLGKILLTNPIFLIAAVVIGIGVALFALKDKVKIIGDAFDFLGSIVEDVIKLFTDLTDAIGLTSVAADKAAKESVKAYQKNKDEFIKNSNLIQDEIQREIDIQKSLGKDVTDLEIKKREARQESLNQIIKQTEIEISLRKQFGAITDEEYEKQVGYIAALKKENEDLATQITVIGNVQAQTNEDKNEKIAADNLKLQEKIEADNEKLVEQTKIANANLITDEKLKAEELAKISFEKRQEEIRNSEADNSVKNEALKTAELTYQADLLKISEDANAKKLAIETKAIEDAKQLKIAALNEELNAIDIRLLGVEKGSEEELTILQERLLKESDLKLESVVAGSEAEKLINEQYFADATALEDEYLANQKAKQEQARADRVASITEGLSQASSAVSDIGNLSNAIFDAQLAKSDEKYKQQLEGVEKGSIQEYNILLKKTNEENKIKKKQFEVNKKVKLAETAINTASSAIAAFGSLASIPIVGPILGGIAAGIAVATGIAQIAKIRATTFEGTALPSAPSASGGGDGGISAPTSSTVNTPSLSSISLFGNASTVNTTGGNVNQPTSLRAYVVESDVTSSQVRLARYRTDAEIG